MLLKKEFRSSFLLHFVLHKRNPKYSKFDATRSVPPSIITQILYEKEKRKSID